MLPWEQGISALKLKWACHAFFPALFSAITTLWLPCKEYPCVSTFVAEIVNLVTDSYWSLNFLLSGFCLLRSVKILMWVFDDLISGMFVHFILICILQWSFLQCLDFILKHYNTSQPSSHTTFENFSIWVLFFCMSLQEFLNLSFLSAHLDAEKEIVSNHFLCPFLHLWGVESMWHSWSVGCKDAGRASSVVGWLPSPIHCNSQLWNDITVICKDGKPQNPAFHWS